MLSVWWVLLSDFTYVKEVTVNLVGTTEGPEAKRRDRTEMGVTETRVTCGEKKNGFPIWSPLMKML